MRVWLDPERLAIRSLTAGDVVAGAARAEHPGRLRRHRPAAGAGRATTFQLPVNTLGRLLEPEQFDDIIIKTGADGRITRVRDVARIELGARDYAVNSYLDNEPAVAMAIAQRPGSNALATADARRADDGGAVEELSRRAGVPHRLQPDRLRPRVDRRGRSTRCSRRSSSS